MQNPKVKHAIRDIIIVVAGVAAVWLGILAAFGTPNPFYVVSSGSMEPVLDIGDVLVVKNGATFNSVQRGDIIVFNRPEVHDRVIVHRIVDIKESSEKIITTKGDANPASIPGTDFPITKDDYIGEVVYVIPKVGHITRYIQPPYNYIIIAIILGILFFNRTSHKKDKKPEIPTSVDNLPDTMGEKKDNTFLPETIGEQKDNAFSPDPLLDHEIRNDIHPLDEVGNDDRSKEKV
jgi:signal peptidase